MTPKSQPGLYTKDGAKHICLTDGNGNIYYSVPVQANTLQLKAQPGAQAKDGSIYGTVTDGNGYTKV